MNFKACVKSLSFLALLVQFTLPINSALAASVVDLRVLVISTGTAEEDLGLDLIDDLLDEIGIAYDVLDSSREELTEALLFEGERGFYNGIILTNAMLYYSGAGNYMNSGFTLTEWQTLHEYERTFSVRESVISGFPVSGAYHKNTYDLDYGMDLSSIEAGPSFTGIWQAPAGGTELFEYVNTNNTLPITDYSVIASPDPAPTSTSPSVAPVLIDQASGKALVSLLSYPDGREVLYSGIANAWYLVHSQILNYEFVNFATKGIFIGARKVRLAAHVDDLFLADGLWNPDTNMTEDEPGFRGSETDILNLVDSRKNLLAQFSTLEDFKLDMVFNGGGAIVEQDQTIVADADTWIRESRKSRNYGNYTYGYFEKQFRSSERMLIHFPVQSASLPAIKATLTLHSGDTATRSGKVCSATMEWIENEATWNAARYGIAWSSRGGAYDNASCIDFRQINGTANVDVSNIVNEWAMGSKPNYGFIVLGSNRYEGRVYTRENTNASLRPTLVIDYPEDSLVDAVVENKAEFRFINHTLTHRDMFTSVGTTYEQAYNEINENLNVWQLLGLPELEENRPVLVTGNHSGLDDVNGNEADPSVWTHYPEGMNVQFMAAAEDSGIRYLASDSSRINQAEEAYVPGFNILLLPRYPTSIFYNTSTPLELVDEYNYIFYERHIEAGEDPCLIPEAICQPRSFEEILESEADTTLRHMLTYRSWPHYFHISNLREYEVGSTLMYDWLNSVMTRYEQYLSLPVINDTYYDIGKRTEARVAAKNAVIEGQLDMINGTVTLTASSNVTIEVTGIAEGELYGGQRQGTVNIGTTPVTIATDRSQSE